MQLAQQLHHRLAVGRVEVAGRLVRQEDGRIARDRARDRDALLLAARELRREVLHPVRHADALEGRLHPPSAVRPHGMPR